MKSLLVFLGIVAAVAASGAFFTPGPWYETLVKPAWTPPDAVFAPVWSALYLTIAIAGWLVWREGEREGARVRAALAAWGVQLALNALWSFLFFGLHRIGLALADILLLVAAISLTVALFVRVRPLAAVLLLPYLAWVGFAGALNAAIFARNG